LALHVIVGAGYGYYVDWDGPDEFWTGHQMTFKNSIRFIIDNLYTFILVPRSLLKILPIKHFEMVERSYVETKRYFTRLIELERQGKPDTHTGKTILSTLIENSSKDKAEDDLLTETEIQGNSFLLFLAGHETRYYQNMI
jgi:cytochrome P450